MLKNAAIAVLFLASGCGPAYYLKRAEKNLRKAELLGASVRADTLYVTKEIIVPEVRTDTLLAFKYLTDTLTITKDKLITKIKIDTALKTVYISTKCLPDTVRLEIPVKITREIKPGFPWGWLVLAWCLGAVMGLFASRRRG